MFIKEGIQLIGIATVHLPLLFLKGVSLKVITKKLSPLEVEGKACYRLGYLKLEPPRNSRMMLVGGISLSSTGMK